MTRRAALKDDVRRMLADYATAEQDHAMQTTEPWIKDGTPLGRPMDWGFFSDPKLVMRQALFYERSGYQRFMTLDEIAAIPAAEWEDVQMMLRLLAFYRWQANPAGD